MQINLKVLSIVLTGNLGINLPILLAGYYTLYADLQFRMEYLIVFFLISYLYWSLAAPMYKSYAVKKLENRNEYILWRKWSVFSGLIWPLGFVLNNTELWDDEAFINYNDKVHRLVAK